MLTRLTAQWYRTKGVRGERREAHRVVDVVDLLFVRPCNVTVCNYISVSVHTSAANAANYASGVQMRTGRGLGLGSRHRLSN